MGNMLFVEAAAKAASSSSTGSSSAFLIVIVVVFVGLFLLMNRSSRNRQRRTQQTQRDLAVGAHVRTTAGLYGTVTAVQDDDVILEVAPGVELRFLRRAVMEVIPGDADDGPAADEDAYEDAYEDAAGAGEDGADAADDAPAGEGPQAGVGGTGATANERAD